MNNNCFVILVYDTSMKISPYLLSHKIILSDTTNMQEKKMDVSWLGDGQTLFQVSDNCDLLI